MTNLEAERPGISVAEPPVFALDIGTRSVIGVVGRQEDGLFRVLDIEVKEHTKRAMFDGQIEDVEQVAEVARAVKTELERRQGLTLQRVCVAAAGRALKIVRASYEMELSPAEPISARDAYELEMAAVERARAQLEETAEGRGLCCVGHALVRSFLDGYPFLTIVNHKGSHAKVEIIATFLPKEVVDSLYAAMAMVGLEVERLTLEPIAAMNAVIPAELRLLNLALVDIGAGTSDIAISQDGSVCAYTMATVAGDEITESIIRHFLVDFKTAEEMKHAVSRGVEEITYRDILDFEYTVPLCEVLETMRPAIEELSQVVCEKILEANNGKAPSAVFLVGGGSQAPLLCGLMAEHLALDAKKVAVGGNNFIKRVACSEAALEGPEYATPLGIALTAVSTGSHEGFYVTINGKRMRVFRAGPLPAMDVLLMCGYQYADLMGKNGKSLTYELNGQRRFLRGGYLVPAQIAINDVIASISTPVTNGDEIRVQVASSGVDARLTVRELEPDPAELSVTFNGTPIVTGRRILVNGAPAQSDDEIHDLDKVEHYNVSTLGALCAQMGLSPEGCILVVNGAAKEPDYRLCSGDQILCVGSSPEFLRPVQAAPKEATTAQTVPVQAASVQAVPAPPAQPPIPEEPMQPIPQAGPVWPEHVDDYPDDDDDGAWQAPTEQAAQPAPQARREEPVRPAPSAALAQQPEQEGEQQPIGLIHVTVNDSAHVLPKKELPYQFLDMLNLVDIDPSKPQGDIILRLNGREASYLEEIGDGDQVEIYWNQQ